MVSISWPQRVGVYLIRLSLHISHRYFSSTLRALAPISLLRNTIAAHPHRDGVVIIAPRKHHVHGQRRLPALGLAALARIHDQLVDVIAVFKGGDVLRQVVAVLFERGGECGGGGTGRVGVAVEEGCVGGLGGRRGGKEEWEGGQKLWMLGFDA